MSELRSDVTNRLEEVEHTVEETIFALNSHEAILHADSTTDVPPGWTGK